MFSGIVKELGTVQNMTTGTKPRISVQTPLAKDLGLGDSIAVNGVCLTVTDTKDAVFSADVMPETLRKTDLGGLSEGSPVNLEPSLKVGDEIGGHMVSGHVDTVGRIVKVKREKNAVLMWIGVDGDFMKFIAPKGSVAVDGVSLTVVDADDMTFSVSLIPHTMKITTLGSKEIGSLVNIEVDMMARYVQRLLEMGGK